MNITIKIGKDDEEQVASTITVEGCSCRMEDFTLALVSFANDWRKEADKNERKKEARKAVLDSISNPTDNVTKKPCGGCGDKKKNAQ